jgi:hypothetical protein
VTDVRVAALYDIHGNLPALDAVLADVAAAGPDVIVSAATSRRALSSPRRWSGFRRSRRAS